MNSYIQIKNGFFHYKKPFSHTQKKRDFILDNINLEIARGEKLGIVGRNGSGKTTLLKILSGLYKLNSGEYNSKIEFINLFESSDLGFHEKLTGEDNVLYSLKMAFNDDEKIKKLSYFIRDLSDIGDYYFNSYNSYSKGMKARLSFSTAIGIISEKTKQSDKIGLIIDESLTSGDIFFLAKVQIILNKILSDKNLTVILVSHSTSQIIRFCNRCIYLNKGKIILDGKVIDSIKKYELDIYKDLLLSNEKEKQDLRHVAGIKSNFFVSKPNVSTKNNEIFFESIYLKNAKNVLTQRVKTNQNFNIEMSINSKSNKTHKYVISILFFTKKGDWLYKYISPVQNFNNKITKKISFKKTIFNSGPLILSIGIHKTKSKITFNDHYQLLNRSFSIDIISNEFENNSIVDCLDVKMN